MKTDQTDVQTSINKKESKELFTESKETAIIDEKTNNNQRSFGLLDLWNIQKRQRTGYSMRRRIE